MPDAHGTDPAPSAAYTLARLTTRRGVRAALAVSSLQHGIRAAREAWSSPAAMDAPPAIRRHLPYPELRVAHIGDGAVTAGVAPSEALQAATWRTRLRSVKPDLVLIDGEGSLSGAGDLAEVVEAARAAGSLIVAHGPGTRLAEAAGVSHHLSARLPDVGPGTPADDALLPWVDPSQNNPIGLDNAPAGTWQLDLGRSPTDQVTSARSHATVIAPLSGGEKEHAAAVLRILASGVPVVATRTPLLTRLLGPNDTWLLREDELGEAERALRDDEEARERASVRLRRHVLATCSVRAAFEQILQSVGIPPRRPPTISVLLATRRPELVASALAMVDGQDMPRLDIQLMLHGISPELPERALSPHRELTVHNISGELPLGAALNVGLEAATGEFIAKMDDDDLYGASHLRDLLVALDYSGADAVGRWSNVIHLEERDVTVHQHVDRQERWAHHLPGCTLLVRGAVLRGLRWRRVPRAVDTELVRAIHGSGGRCYSTHRFGFIRRRHGDHTFARADRAFEQEGRSTPGLDRSVLDV